MGDHLVEHDERLDRVCSEVLVGMLDGLRNLDVAGQVHHRVTPRERRSQHGPVADGTYDELSAGVDGLTMTAFERIEHHAFVTRVQKRASGDGADVAGAAGDEESHGCSFRSYVARR